MKRALIRIALAACVIFAVFSGCSDKGTNSVPSELLGTWWYVSGTLNGVEYNWFAYYNNDVGDTMSYSLNSDRTWDRVIYNYSMDTLLSMAGIFYVKGDSLITTMTAMNGSPLQDPILVGYIYGISSGQLSITHTADNAGSTDVTVMTYVKE